VGELVILAKENPDFFKALFLKIGKEGFATGNIPWSVFKELKNQLNSDVTQELYFFITKYFLDNHGEEEEICSFSFTVKEYKDLIKFFLSTKEDLLDENIVVNKNSELEFLDFILL